MPTQLSAALSKVMDFVRGFSVAQRTIALIGVAAIVLGGIALGSWLTRPSYAPLFTGLAASDASSIVNQLTADGVPYQLTDGGATILVPQSDVYTERLKAASNNLPSTTTSGYALLDNMSVTTSQFQQDVMYKQAMQEELQNTIDAMQGVSNSSVQLALPTQSVFTSQQQDPTASVFVSTSGGNSLTSSQVDAIVHLVSASITGMKSTDVTVVDAQGNVLSTAGGDPAADATKAQTAYDTQTQTAIQTMLDKIVGPGNSTVAVAATVSGQTGTEKTVQYTAPPGGAPSTSAAKETESYSGGAGSQAGVLGPNNIAVPSGTATNGAYQYQNEQSSNAVNSTTTTTQTPAGQVVRQTVSVAINQKVAAGVNMAQLQSLVQSAAGYNRARGDVVTVSAQPFSTVAATTAQSALAQSANQAAAAQRAQLIRTGIIAAAIAISLIAIAALLTLGRRRRHLGEVVDPVLDYHEVVTDDELAELLPGGGTEAAAELDFDPDADSIEKKKREIGAFASSDPARTAALLRGLMDQEIS